MDIGLLSLVLVAVLFGLLALPVVMALHALLGHSVFRLGSRKPVLTTYRTVMSVICSFFSKNLI